MRKLLLGAVLCACLSSPAHAQQAAPLPIRVGAAMPQSGHLADIAADLRKALLLWQEEVNAGGGLLGRRVELQLLDDRSGSGAAGRAHHKRIRGEQARARGDAAALGLAAGEVEVHAPGTSDFAPQVARAKAAGAGGWIAFGLPQDAAEMVKSFRRLGS